jgi:hypothetical protein
MRLRQSKNYTKYVDKNNMNTMTLLRKQSKHKFVRQDGKTVNPGPHFVPPQIVHENGKFPTKNLESFDREY